MKVSELFMPTLREAPSEADAVSHKLMLRAGLMRKTASGIYSFLPLGLRVFRKIERIVREEMDRAGAQELAMPSLLPAEYYQSTGRWEVFGPDMFRLKDRGGREFCLGPTHEEVFTQLVKQEIRSYRSLPLILYQIQTKYRDEIRPRFGVMRSREFVMKDAYSFDADDEGLGASYRRMYDAYCRILERCGLRYVAAEADSGAMGGSGSNEFIAISEIGEANVAICVMCGYAANVEKAECPPAVCDSNAGHGTAAHSGTMDGAVAHAASCEPKEMKLVETPDAGTIEQLVRFLGCGPAKFAKTLIFKADGRVVAAMVRGDRELNETKLQNLLGCSGLEMADADTVREVTCAEVGFAGPVGLKAEIIADYEVAGMTDMIVGANKTGFHLAGVKAGRDFKPAVAADIRTIAQGDCCPRCGAGIDIAKGIEVGHIFKLGTKYSSAMDCTYIDGEGAERPMVMGSYGIGINRMMAAVIEQHNDGNGIIWPDGIAPFHVIIVPVNTLDKVQMECAASLYRELQSRGVEVLLDDRDERAGVKFKDADLIGIPVRITIGRKAVQGIVELTRRSDAAVQEIELGKAAEAVKI